MSHPTGVRELKLRLLFLSKLVRKSHPTGVRELKRLVYRDGELYLQSHPTGVRELKHPALIRSVFGPVVAPHWGA